MLARSRRSFLARAAGAALGSLALLGAAVPAQAQGYPSRPITLIVPWGAGGGTDATARIIGSLLEKELGQPVTVVNRTGGSGVVGHAAIAAAAPEDEFGDPSHHLASFWSRLRLNQSCSSVSTTSTAPIRMDAAAANPGLRNCEAKPFS